jgi:hypothetical protein
MNIRAFASIVMLLERENFIGRTRIGELPHQRENVLVPALPG